MQALFQFDLRDREYAADESRLADEKPEEGSATGSTQRRGALIDEMCRAELRSRQKDDDEHEVDPLDDPERKLNSAEREILQFSTRLVEGTLSHRDEIDAKLQGVTRNWDLRRMAIVDRNVLRMAVYELMWCKDVPPKVAINEAIEIGKKFSTANSGGFVNGILDRIRIDLERTRKGGQADASSD